MLNVLFKGQYRHVVARIEQTPSESSPVHPDHTEHLYKTVATVSKACDTLDAVGIPLERVTIGAECDLPIN